MQSISGIIVFGLFDFALVGVRLICIFSFQFFLLIIDVSRPVLLFLLLFLISLHFFPLLLHIFFIDLSSDCHYIIHFEVNFNAFLFVNCVPVQL